MLRIFHNTSYDFIKYWRRAAVLTIVFILVGLTALVIRGARYSIEFTGGTTMQVEFAKAPNPDVIRSTVDGAGFSGSTIQQFGSPTAYTINAQPKSGASAATAAATDSTAKQIEAALHAQFGDTSQVRVLSSQYVGPQVGQELRRNAMIAVAISFLVTLIYLAIRFEWRFGVAAVVATAHDVFTTLAFLSMLRLEISLTVVAAILTVIGYSLNDTIIIFDRVREDLRKQRKEPFRDTVNRGINETLPRSVLTHVTTLTATLALLFFAGVVIRPFAWIMAFGIFTGTFSSIYVAGALLIWIEAKWPPSVEGRGAAAAPVVARLAMAVFVDSHAHLADPAFDADREEVVERARLTGARAVVCIGESLAAAARARALASRHPGFLSFTAGIHPHDAAGFDPLTDPPRIAEECALGAVAIGECGLDYHYDHAPPAEQRRAFAAQLALARDLRRPVVVHTREAEADTHAMVTEAGAGGVRGVLHCYTGSHDLAEEALAVGWYVSFSGIVTFRKWDGDALLRLVPDDRLLVESDAPYLAPVPHRGKRNEPAWVSLTLHRVAEARGVDAGALGPVVVRNAARLFGLAIPDAP